MGWGRSSGVLHGPLYGSRLQCPLLYSCGFGRHGGRHLSPVVRPGRAGDGNRERGEGREEESEDNPETGEVQVLVFSVLQTEIT